MILNKKRFLIALSSSCLMLPVMANEKPEALNQPESQTRETIRMASAAPDFEAFENLFNWLEADAFGVHTTFSIGYQGLNLQGLNQTLAQESYSPVPEQSLSLGGGLQFRVFHILSEFEGQVNLMAPSLNTDYSLQPTSGLFLFNLGYVFRPHKNLNIYPLAGIGTAMLDLNFSQRAPVVSFGDFLKNPGRQGAVLNTMLAFNLGLGVDGLGDWFGLLTCSEIKVSVSQD